MSELAGRLLVTISGLPGSGTSTLAKAVSVALDVPHLDGGSVWRSMAGERGLTVSQFSVLSEDDPGIDLELDQRLAARARAGRLVLESRLAGWIATNEGLDATRVWLDCDEDERARRVAAREDHPMAEALAANRFREASERSRYRTYYGIDLDDRSPYDLILDSTATGPDDLTSAVLAAVRAEG